MKIATIVGTRPQLIKVAGVSKELRRMHEEVIIHTGQHYDYFLSGTFFKELGIPNPDYNLNVGSGTPNSQIGKMLIGLEDILRREKPNIVLVFGDTNSALAGALAAAKLHIKVAHIEAGERNFDASIKKIHPSSIPEETNRVLIDHLSSLLFCTTERAVDNLKNDGIIEKVYLVGDVMFDLWVIHSHELENKSSILKKFSLSKKGYVLATIHREINTNNIENLLSILKAFEEIEEKIIFPLHPRTRRYLEEYNLLDYLESMVHILTTEPVGYIDMLQLEKNARIVLTDSGGVLKEAYFFHVPTLNLDKTTEWIDLVLLGWSRLVGSNTLLIKKEICGTIPKDHPALFGNGNASLKIVDILSTVSFDQ